PSREVIKKELARKLNTKDDLLIINKIANVFGGRKAVIYARAYKDRETLKKSELERLVAKHQPKTDDKKQSEEKPAEAKAE
ncbi:MAG: hypothetical protein V1659_03085, partial [Candidatus Woesearchaeota archaeon]